MLAGLHYDNRFGEISIAVHKTFSVYNLGITSVSTKY